MKKTDRGIIEDILRITSKVANNLQSLRQDVDAFRQDVDKKFEKNKKEHKELEKLILRGDEAIVKLLIKNERRIEKLEERVEKLEEKLKKLELSPHQFTGGGV